MPQRRSVLKYERNQRRTERRDHPGVYKVGLSETADQLEARAAKTFVEGQVAKEQGDAYVLNTVFLATVLFLTAIAENFTWNWIRAVILAIGLVMLVFGIYHLIVFPII